MSVLDIMRKRFSVRKYQKRKISKTKLLKVLEAGRVAPSAHRIQPWHFVVIQDREKIKKMRPLVYQDWITNSPALIIALGDHKISWKREDGKDHCDVDISIAVDHMTLMATDMGLGTCWICWFKPKAVSQYLKLPKHMEPIAILAIGYPDEIQSPNRHSTRRKPMKDIVSWEEYNKN